MQGEEKSISTNSHIGTLIFSGSWNGQFGKGGKPANQYTNESTSNHATFPREQNLHFEKHNPLLQREDRRHNQRNCSQKWVESTVIGIPLNIIGPLNYDVEITSASYKVDNNDSIYLALAIYNHSFGSSVAFSSNLTGLTDGSHTLTVFASEAVMQNFDIPYGL